MTRSVVFTSGVRTAVGAFGGSLAKVPLTSLAAAVTGAAIERAGIAPADIGHCVFGNVLQTGPRDPYLARVAAVEAGVPVETPAVTVNRLCGSGLQAVVSAAQTILLGDAETVVAGGAESMSQAPFLLTDTRWGRRLGDGATVDMLLGALNDPFGNGHMGVTAENIAADHGIGRAEQDAFALESHRRAATAIAEGRFAGQILPMSVRIKGKTVDFAQDEHVRHAIDMPSLEALRPAFVETGTVTAGNASGLNDGAAALVMMEGAAAERHGSNPLARMVSYGHAGVDPSRMGLGPVPAVRSALARAGLTIGDMDVIESNEAFAAQACAVARELGFPAERTNPNGGAVALGHPVGASGAIILVKLIHELHRSGGRFGLATLCIGGGQGIAMIVERVGD